MNDIKNKIDNNNTSCNSLIAIYLTPNVYKLINEELLETDDMKNNISDCLKNKFNGNDLLEKEYETLLNNFFDTNTMYSQNNDSPNYVQAVELYDIVYEDLYINNIEAFNIYIFTVFLLFLSLTLQYGILSFFTIKNQ